MIIIPDIHGRSFWRESVLRHFALLGTEAEDEVERKVVFLGDYLDPYDSEGVSNAAVMDNLRDILLLKRQHADDVVLLLGNHDLPYIFQDIIKPSRFDDEHADERTKLLCDNLDCFQMTYSCSVNDRFYVFSHAGIHPGWMKRYLHTDNILQAMEMFDRPIASMTNEMIRWLNCVSFLRGGNDSVGSMVWADVDEFAMDYNDPTVMQIFGHTQQTSSPVIANCYACLDCRRGFTLGKDGILKEM